MTGTFRVWPNDFNNWTTQAMTIWILVECLFYDFWRTSWCDESRSCTTVRVGTFIIRGSVCVLASMNFMPPIKVSGSSDLSYSYRLSFSSTDSPAFEIFCCKDARSTRAWIDFYLAPKSFTFPFWICLLEIIPLSREIQSEGTTQ